MATGIEWTDESWNVVHGCTKISTGCLNCYAERMARRLAGRCGYAEAPRHFDVRLRRDRLRLPFGWRKPRRVFVCSMGDLFHERVPFEFIDDVFGVMAEAGQHVFQVLTKRAERMYGWMRATKCFGDKAYFPNVWFGVSAENQEEFDRRVPWLLKMPARVRFVSVEPMLGRVGLQEFLYEGGADYPWMSYRDDHWVICGCESGPGARGMDLDWARGLRDECREAGVPFFLKQMRAGGRVIKMPELDGAMWDGFPGGE